MTRAFVLCLAGAVLAGTTACKASYLAPTAVVPIVAVQLHYQSALGDLSSGSHFSLRAFSIDADNVWRDVTDRTAWLSSNPAVLRAAVPPSTLHRAVGPGRAEIVGVYEGWSDGLMVVVHLGQPPSPYLYFLPPGDPRVVGWSSTGRVFRRESSGQAVDVTASATWRSSDTRIATVEAGRVTGIGPGTAEITVTHGALTSRYGLSIEPPSR